MQSPPKWISVKDRLPEVFGASENSAKKWSDLIAVTDGVSVEIGTYYVYDNGQTIEKQWLCYDSKYGPILDGEITHWYPLPDELP